jgi:hypothetical protein
MPSEREQTRAESAACDGGISVLGLEWGGMIVMVEVGLGGIGIEMSFSYLDSRFTFAVVPKLQCANCEVRNGVWFAARWCGCGWGDAHFNGLGQARGGEEERTEKACGAHLGMW